MIDGRLTTVITSVFQLRAVVINIPSEFESRLADRSLKMASESSYMPDRLCAQ